MFLLRSMLSRYGSMQFAGSLMLLAITNFGFAESLGHFGLMNGFGAPGGFAFNVVGGRQTTCNLVATGSVSALIINGDDSGCIYLVPSFGTWTLQAGQSYHITNEAVTNNYYNFGVQASGCIGTTNDRVSLTLYCDNGSVYPAINPAFWIVNCTNSPLACSTTTGPLTVTLP